MLEKFTRILDTLARQPRTPGRGGRYEAMARDFLARQGLTDFRCNVRSRYGEIDLIARDGDALVFVEVRYRHRPAYGSPVATVTPAKQRKIRRTAQHFLQKHGLTNRMPCRFDVVGISDNAGRPDYQWIKNAF